MRAKHVVWSFGVAADQHLVLEVPDAVTRACNSISEHHPVQWVAFWQQWAPG